jgi:two-component system, OmpR family, response regulator
VNPARQPLVAPASPAHPRPARVRRPGPGYATAEAHDFYGDPSGYAEAAEPRVLRCGDLVLDEARWTVHRAGTLVDLSPTEFRLLACLLRHQGSVLTRTQLLQHVWGLGYTGQPQVVETYVSYLRRKLHRLGPPLIHTRRGLGYLLRSPDQAGPGPVRAAR